MDLDGWGTTLPPPPAQVPRYARDDKKKGPLPRPLVSDVGFGYFFSSHSPSHLPVYFCLICISPTVASIVPV